MSRPGRWGAVFVVGALLLAGCAGDDAADDTGDGTEEPTETTGTTGTTAAPPGTDPRAGATGQGLGFEIATHGFSFENYGNDDGVTNLTTAELHRMFGDAVCARGTGPACTLTPPARTWMKEMNDAMSGGHCEGMATLSLLMQQGAVDPQRFGGPTAASLRLDGNVALQREIAYWFVTQSLDPTAAEAIKGTPSEIVERLRRWFAAAAAAKDPDRSYTLGIYKPGYVDGHAVTAIGLLDRPDGTVDIQVYDNNYPGELRAVTVDLRADTWSYAGSTNPAEAEGRYEGDTSTRTLELTPTAARLQPQACPFCDGGGGRGAASTKGSLVAPTQVFLDPEAFRAGVTFRVRAVGGGELVGVGELRPRGGRLWDRDTPPILLVPAGTAFQVELDATAARTTVDTDVAVVATGLSGGVDDVTLAPGQRDVLVVEPTRRTLRYTTTADEAPTLYVGIDGDPDSYAFALGGVELGRSGGTIELRLDTAARRLIARSTGSDTATLLFLLERVSDTVEETLDNDGVRLAPNETVVFEYGAWRGEDAAVTAGIDTNGDDVIDEPFEILDES